MEPLFSFGTLQFDKVQRELFGRSLHGTPDALTGFRIGRVAISNPDAVSKSGKSHHPGLVVSDKPEPQIAGTVFELNSSELAAADEYEASDYARQRVTLESGRQAWVYVAAPGVQVE